MYVSPSSRHLTDQTGLADGTDSVGLLGLAEPGLAHPGLAEPGHIGQALLDTTANRSLLGIGPFAIGLAAVVLLVAAVWLGIRYLRDRPDPPTPDEQPHLPPSGPVGEVQEHPHEAEMPHDGRRLRPYEIHPHSTTPEDETDDQPRRDEGPDDSSSRGSG